MNAEPTIRRATRADAPSIWKILEPVIRAGETYSLPRDLSREDTLSFWFGKPHEVFVAAEEDRILGTYFLAPNQRGGGSHVVNCGYVTDAAQIGRGIARQMCLHSLDYAKMSGFLAMQFNFVVSTNTRAVRLWLSLGFEVVGRLPGAFRHPSLGFVDALILFRVL